MPVDYKEGTWTIGAEGVGADRTVIGVIWAPDNGDKGLLFECGHEVILSRPTKIKNILMPAGQKAIIVDLRDPTLSPKHYNFIDVYFEEFDVSEWISIDDVVDSAQGQESNLTEYTTSPGNEAPPTLH